MLAVMQLGVISRSALPNFHYYGPGPLGNTPDTTPPLIIQSGLIDNKTYDSKTVAYLLTVVKPSLWFNESRLEGRPPVGKLLSIDLIVDGVWFNLANDTFALADEYEKWNSVTVNGTLPELSEGKHTVEFSVESLVYYSSPNRTWLDIYSGDYPDKYFFTSRSGEIALFVDTASSTAESETENASPWLPVAVVCVAVATFAVAGAVYRRKRKRGVSQP